MDHQAYQSITDDRGGLGAAVGTATWQFGAWAHTIGDIVERAYRPGDRFAKRVALMADWAVSWRPRRKWCRCGRTGRQ
jgi:hypothetical protein